jgi:TetR/AcrR family transcriptional regulator
MVDKAARGGRRPRDSDATREALLAAGTELFAERGYDGVPLSAIADKAGVNKAMVSYHFGGKRKLYLAIMTVTFADIVDRAEKLSASDRPAPVLLRELVGLVAETATRRNPYFPAMMLREALTGGRHLRDETIAYPLRVAEVVRLIVERGVREGSFRPVDPLLTHLSLVGSMVFFFATKPLRERLFAEGRLRAQASDVAGYVKHMQDLLIDGLAARRPRRGREERAS